MRSLGPAIDSGIPHEASHIVVGRAVGLPVRGLDMEVVRYPEAGLSVGNLATLSYFPSDEDIRTLAPEVRAAFILQIGGGVAGNKFCGVTTIDPQGAEADRKQLARLTKESLEKVSDMALPIINKHRRLFRQLVSLTRQRYIERILKNRNIETGRHMLVTQEDLDRLFAEYVSSGGEKKDPDSSR